MEEGEKFLWKSDSSSSSMVSAKLGRVMNALLGARRRKLSDAISKLSSDSRAASNSSDSLDESLWFLHRHVKDAAEKNECLDDILVPMLENSLRSKELKHSHGGQSMIILNWLFQDEFLFQAIATNLAKIIATKDDRFIALGWCTLVRGLVECECGSDQYPLNGIRQRNTDVINTFSTCIPNLSLIVCKGSTLQDGFELPSRLAVSAADCLLILTESLTKIPVVPSNKKKLSDSSNPSWRVVLLDDDKKANPPQKLPEVSQRKLEYLLWDHLESLIDLVRKLCSWSKKSRPVHFKGVERVLKWLKEIETDYRQLQSGSIKTGALLLNSCWKHYSLLLCLEDHKGSHHYNKLLEQYLSGLQVYTNEQGGGHSENKESAAETRKFFLNCLCLLLGRFYGKKFENIVLEYGTKISQAIFPQLQSADEDVIESVVCILKAVIFMPQISSGNRPADQRESDALLSLLIDLLDEQDGAARAVVMLLAECCIMSRDQDCLKEVLKRLGSETIQQRKNAIEVISELIRISSESTTELSHSSREDIGKHLLERIEDEETSIREQASALLPMFDPSMILPSLVNLVYSTDENVQLAASGSLLSVLKHHNQNADVICMLLDCLINLSHTEDLQKGTGGGVLEGSKCDKVLSLIPEWARSVPNWNILVGPLIDKMFSHPANATIVRFLSHISKHLAEAADVVLSHVLVHTKGQRDMDESSFSRWESRTHSSDDFSNLQQFLFEHLCPLLIIRMLPLSVFNDMNSSVMYGQLIDQDTCVTKIKCVPEYGDVMICGHESIASLLFKRAFDKFEFEDVRKLAAELCGRIHPQVLVPIVRSQLDRASSSRDLLQLKTCLFSLCTSLMVRGGNSLSEPGILEIRKSLEKVLLWPSLDGDETSRAQHGCIDCLALMICAELQDPNQGKKIIGPGKKHDSNKGYDLVLNYVIDRLTSDENEAVSTSDSSRITHAISGPSPLPFRLCMANVLISACQKIPDPGKKRYAKRALSRLISSVESVTDSDIRAACIQVMFSAVYHLKSTVRPYAPDLLKLSLKALKKGSEKEKMAGAKLVASLMGSEDEVLETISGGLLEARSVLSSISLKDPSMELRQICTKLLACIV